MTEILILLAVLFVAYLYLPTTWLDKLLAKRLSAASGAPSSASAIPEDSVLRRHFLTQIRSEIEQELSPRPTDFNLQRHYDSLINAELENRLALMTS